MAQSLLPRGATAYEDFELVVVLEPTRLVLYVDRLASNEPVLGARVEVEGAGLSGVAVEGAGGAYAIALGAPVPPGHHALTITLQAGAEADLLSATLDVPAPPAAAPAAARRWILRIDGGWPVALAAGLLALATLFLLRRRRLRLARTRQTTGAST